MIIIGVDEAGRGSVVGPMVMGLAGVKDLKKLENLDIRDSKEMSKEEREKVFEDLIKVLDYYDYVIIEAKVINDMMSKNINLTNIELKFLKELLEKIEDDFELYLDSFSINKEKIRQIIENFGIKNLRKIIVDFDADKKYKITSAASIIAKVIRDREIRKLEEELNIPIGSGYPHDERTRKFIEYALRNRKYLEYIRKEWQTVDKIREELFQTKLTQFIK